MTFRPLPAVVLVCLALVHPTVAQSDEARATAVQEAQTAAESWLALVDEDAFGESWDEAASLFQERVDRADWVQKAERLRDSVAAFSSRTLTRTQYRNALDRAQSNGPFVLLKYRATLEADRFEEVLLAVRQDTTWKVAGYQVAPLPTSSSSGSGTSSSP